MDVEHVVVLMLENNSFDRMLGNVPRVDGIDPNSLRTNPDLRGTSVSQSKTTMRVMLCDPANPNSQKVDPEHDLADVLEQMEGPNLGFVKNFQRHYSQCKPDCWAEVMRYYGLGSLPVLHQLARSFAVCDQWFSSLPGPTWPNRYFVHSGTSLGHTDMPEGIFHPNLHLYDQETVYDRLNEAGKSWAIYYGDVPQTLTMTHMLSQPSHFHKMDQFFKDASGPEASFPNYSFLEPTYFGGQQNDQHPPSDVLRGEVLLAQVYNAIRSNESLWQKTLFVILYDEHGGFYDHVYPPACVPPRPVCNRILVYTVWNQSARDPSIAMVGNAGDLRCFRSYEPAEVCHRPLGTGPAGCENSGGKVVCFVLESLRGITDGCPNEDCRADDAAQSGGGSIESKSTRASRFQPVSGDEERGTRREAKSGGREGYDFGDRKAATVVDGAGSAWRSGSAESGAVPGTGAADGVRATSTWTSKD